MCDLCGDVQALLYSHDERMHATAGGLQLTKQEVFALLNFSQQWQQRQCMCCFKTYKNFERLNNLVQVAMNLAIQFIQSLPRSSVDEEMHKAGGDGAKRGSGRDRERVKKKKKESVNVSKKDVGSGEACGEPQVDVETEVQTDGGSVRSKERGEEEEVTSSSEVDSSRGREGGDSDTHPCKPQLSDCELEVSSTKQDEELSPEEPAEEPWSPEEKDRLFQFVTRLFLMNFPLYVAYKHAMPSSLEELSQQEVAALNNYCELADPDVPVHLLRNVCFFCDRNGIQAIAHCFDKASPDVLPYTVAHTLINIIANLRLWMNINTVMQCIVPLRSHVIRYMCRLSDTELRLAGMRNMTDLMWAAMKEPLDTHLNFDREGLELAFKYFTCTTLTIRIAGIAQINNQISLYNEIANTNDTLMDADRLVFIGNSLANWLIERRIIEHIFGPNLHVELIKQSQMILNFLAIEGRVTNEHIDYIWAAGQLKHCSRQVHDLLIPLIKNLEPGPNQHLLHLVSALDPSAHTEQTLYLASALIKFLWNLALSQSVDSMLQSGDAGQAALAARAKELPHRDMGKAHEASSSEMSDSAEASDKERVHAVAHRFKARHILRQQEESGEEEFDSENSSLGNESELSQISDDSLPSEIRKLRRQHLRHKRLCRKVGLSDSEGEGSELSEGEIVPSPRYHRRQHLHHKHLRMLHHHHHHHQHKVESSEENEEEEEEEEEYLLSEEAELMRQVKMISAQQVAHDSELEAEALEAEEPEGRGQCQHAMCLLAHQQDKAGRTGGKEEEEEEEVPMLESSAEDRPVMDKTIEEEVDKADSAAVDVTSEVAEVSSEPPAGGKEDPGTTEEDGQKPLIDLSNTKQSNTMEVESKDCRAVEGVEPEAGDVEQSGEVEPDGDVGTEAEAAEVDTAEVASQQLAYLQHMQAQAEQQEDVTYMEAIMSPDEGSCNSSHLSAKSEKNMADFEGEEVLSEAELASLASHAHFAGRQHMQQQLANMARLYQKRSPKDCASPPTKVNVTRMSAPVFKYDDVTKPGETLLWDLLQEHNAYKLADGLVAEAEKVLYSLVCFSTDRRIRTKFIEACIENIANHRSVLVSLRLLPKLFGSFQQYRGGLDTHTVTMWADNELKMTRHFFNNLTFYTNAVKRGVKFPHALYSYREEIQVRLQFLAAVFSSIGSPDHFRLSLEQVSTLWMCLATDPECADDCFNWFLNQAKSKEHHAMSLETFKHIFMEKMPTLKPEDMSMVGLNLFTQLCNLAKIANASLEEPLEEDKISGMDQLWGIALRANNTDVSLNAIQYLNNYYINYGSCVLEKEEEFVSRCMDSLVSSSQKLEQSPDTSLLVIQRGLVLMTTHLESFRKRYAFHLRQWQLDNLGISSHQKSLQEKTSQPIRVILQPAGSSEKTVIEMLTHDLVAELRAEVTRWWSTLPKPRQSVASCPPDPTTSLGRGGSALTPILGAMLGDGPIRMITLGQELTTEVDTKTLSDMQFKDNQLVFVSLGASRPPRKHDGSIPASYLPSPPRNKLPMMLLLAEPHFDQLFSLLQQLSHLRCIAKAKDSQAEFSMETKARVLSRKVWELFMVLPTNMDMLQGFKAVGQDEPPEEVMSWDKLLDPDNPHKLMYSLQIVEALSRTPKHRRRSMFRSRTDSVKSTDSEISALDEELPEETWSKRFIRHGGLKHLFNIFQAGTLQTKEGDHWSEWSQDCLAYLLRLISQFAVTQADPEQQGADEAIDSYESPRKKQRKGRGADRVLIPTLNKTILKMIDIDSVLQILMTILYDAAMPSGDSQQWQMASWGRTEVVHYSLSFLISWAHSCPDVQPALCSHPRFSAWLKRLTLEAPEPQVRQEGCRGLYRLCMGQTTAGKTGYPYLVPCLASMLQFLSEAQKMKPIQKQAQDEKEPYGPGCRDYFWLVCRLVENMSRKDAARGWEEEDSLVDLNALIAEHLVPSIRKQPFIEQRHGLNEDDALIGLLHLATVVMKHDPPFKAQSEGQGFLDEVFMLLFALPSPQQRFLPKCKSQASRSAAFDLLVEMVKGNTENYSLLHARVMKQHHKDSHAAYTWDNWPHEEGRSNCGYVGLTNLGATCYMATCMQHLYMIPQARKSVLEAAVQCATETRHEGTLMELKKMFAYLMESERKAYNPRNFCKVYTMDKQPLNTGEQKDMAEFFTDLISKLEEMGPQLKTLVKGLFGGVITNNVVSLDCPHVSRTKEEFYTVRCQVADMKNLNESLDEVTVKDMLEGDNMYTCSRCQKKVRAEKRACFRRLPQILCFNTMRYTFNMVTMMKEKVNSHFFFPLRLDMANYMEQNLIQSDKVPTEDDAEEDEEDLLREDVEKGYEYELIGVTVHTGTADGGHYYSFIRDRLNKNEHGQDRWYLFNDAEVKPFDPQQIASECFGGEMTSKTYDAVHDKFMDFSFEKTNSAYMLFYERLRHEDPLYEVETPKPSTSDDTSTQMTYKVELAKDLAQWIWEDNMQFLQDKNIFEHTYFGFMWQMCGYIPTTLQRDDPQYNVQLMVAKLSVAFVLETLIHAKEKPMMVQWIELLTKQLNSCHAACEWFLDTMAVDDWWPQQILIKCPNQVVRQMFQRLVIHVISQLRPSHACLYLQPLPDSDDEEALARIGTRSCVTRFIKKMLSILDLGQKAQCKYLSEYFALLLEFAKLGEEECLFLLHTGAIAHMVTFFMGHKMQENYVEILSDEEEEEEEEVVVGVSEERYRPQSLDKMIALVALLVEKSRGENNHLQLMHKDYNAIIGGKGYPFLFHQIRDAINLRQSCNLIFSLCRWNDRLAMAIVQMLFSAISRHGADSGPFFKLLSMLVELMGGPPGMPPFTQLVLHKFWEVTDFCPQQCLDWLSTQVIRNKLAHAWTLQNLDMWVEPYLLAHNNVRVRNAAAYLLVSLIPCPNFRQAFRTTRSMLSPHKDLALSHEALNTLHEIYGHLLRLLPRARTYVDASVHGTMKLAVYFALLTYCLVSRTEKLMFSRHFLELWQLFQPKLSEPNISMHHNKQALLLYWHQVCVDCPENVKLIVSNAHVTKHIAFNYILADHDDQDVVLFNRCMLPAYYGILRMCCQQSSSFTRQLAVHQNIQWAFKNITPYPAQYTAAVDELFKMMQLMARCPPDSKEDEVKAAALFRRNTIQLYLSTVEARTSWQTLVRSLKILLETSEDHLLVIQQQGLPMLQEAFNTVHVMYHEATACHVTGDLVELLSIILSVLKAARIYNEKKLSDVKMLLQSWKDRMEFVRKLLTLLNSYTPPDIRTHTIDVLREMLLLFQGDSLQTMVPILATAHQQFQDSNMPMPMGPYFPKRCQKPISSRSNIRPPRPQFQMFLHSNQLEATRGIDEAYDAALQEFFGPYHVLVDLMVRVSVNNQNLTESLINLSAAVAYEGVPLHLPYFAKLWYEIYQSEHVDKSYVGMLCSSHFFIDYMDAVLLDERQALNNHHIYQFFCNYFPKVYQHVLNDQGQSLLDNLIASITAERATLETVRRDRDLNTTLVRLNGDLRALLLIFSVQRPSMLTLLLRNSLQFILTECRAHQQQRAIVRKMELEAQAKQEEEEVSSTADQSHSVEHEEEVSATERTVEPSSPQPSSPRPSGSESPGKGLSKRSAEGPQESEEADSTKNEGVPRKRRRTCSDEKSAGEDKKPGKGTTCESEEFSQEDPEHRDCDKSKGDSPTDSNVTVDKTQPSENTKSPCEERDSPDSENKQNVDLGTKQLAEKSQDVRKSPTKQCSVSPQEPESSTKRAASPADAVEDKEEEATERDSESDSDSKCSKDSESPEQKAKAGPSRRLGQREKSSTLDHVVKNIELIFDMAGKE